MMGMPPLHPLLPPGKRNCSLSHKEKNTSFFKGNKRLLHPSIFSVPLGVFFSKGNLLLRYLYGFTVSGGKLFPGLGSLQEFIIMQYAAGLSLKRKAS